MLLTKQIQKANVMAQTMHTVYNYTQYTNNIDTKYINIMVLAVVQLIL